MSVVSSRAIFFSLADIFFVCVRVEFTAVAVRFFSFFFGIVLPLARDIFFLSFVLISLCVCVVDQPKLFDYFGLDRISILFFFPVFKFPPIRV